MSRTDFGNAVRHAARSQDETTQTAAAREGFPKLDKRAMNAADAHPVAFAMFVCTAAILEQMKRGQP